MFVSSKVVQEWESYLNGAIDRLNALVMRVCMYYYYDPKPQRACSQ